MIVSERVAEHELRNSPTLSSQRKRWHILTDWPPEKLVRDMGYTYWIACPGEPFEVAI